MLTGTVFQQGHVIIERCERYCWYCYQKNGKMKRWDNPWYVPPLRMRERQLLTSIRYLRRHVIDVHALKTHPNLTCSFGW